MQILFQNVLPIPLADTPLSADTCWKKETSIDTSNRYLVEAPSGTGKTTLVSLIYGIRHDYEGCIQFDKNDVRSFSIDRWTDLRRTVFSAVFQDMRLFPQLSALENIQLKNDLTNTLAETEIVSMAEQLGIGQRLNQSCGTLSLGQQQRVAIIRALAQPFEFLLLDEPFSHLDENNSRKACDLINTACEKNKAGLLLTSLGPANWFPFNQSITI
jgi:putative ABC transport system ATP-binding protein